MKTKYYMIVEFPNGFLDEYAFKTLEDANKFKNRNKDLKFGKIKTTKTLDY